MIQIAAEKIKKEILLLVSIKYGVGSRALGNRSFLADPSLIDIKDKINLKIKLREF